MKQVRSYNFKYAKQLGAEDIAKSRADICGKNGEYHTFVFDGPLFAHPVEFNTGDIIEAENYTIVPIS